MSPFAVYLNKLRMRHDLRQTQMAELMGYEQGYISALELGTKNPSNEEFLAKLVQTFEMTSHEQAELAIAVKESQLRYTLPRDVPPEAFRFCSQLWEKIDRLPQTQWQALLALLSLEVPPKEGRLLSLKTKETEAQM